MNSPLINENILFVCKLNKLTKDEDLEILFSRFGDIVSCNIVKDYQTGESLGYAFIEFQEKSSCDEAYLKMENVLIDKRRIHVDFSNSVRKLWQKYSGHQKQNQQKQQQQQLMKSVLYFFFSLHPNYYYHHHQLHNISSYEC